MEDEIQKQKKKQVNKGDTAAKTGLGFIIGQGAHLHYKWIGKT